MKDYKIYIKNLLVISSILALPTFSPQILIAQQIPAAQLSLDQIYALSAGSPQTITRSSLIVPVKGTENLYTQSQAHMSVPAISKLIASTYSTKSYQPLINQILENEKKYAHEYVFYHGLDNPWRVPQDVYTSLYAHFNNIAPENIKDFIFIRFNGANTISIQNFLINQTMQNGLINDHLIGNDFIAANLALFGNVGNPPECTWEYFIKSRGHANPTKQIYEKIMDTFGLTHKYINELMSLVNTYQTKEQTILQIFVPQDKIDSIGYLSWIRGIPADPDIMHMVMRSVKDKKFPKTTQALDYYSILFKQAQEKNPLFKRLLERLQTKEFSLRYFLDFYRNRPAEIEDINNFQARLFITSDVLLNPYSGVKIFRYSTATAAQLKKYKEKLDAIIQKIIAEKK